jgi:hypothetical protein
VLLGILSDAQSQRARIVPVLGRADRSRRALVIVKYAAKPWTPTNAPDESVAGAPSISPDDSSPGDNARRTPRSSGADGCACQELGSSCEH